MDKVYHLDLKVSMYTEDYLKKLALWLKEHEYNSICVEIDNKLRYEKNPDIAAPDAWTEKEWISYCRWCSNIGIYVYPLVQTLGHMEHILTSNPKYMYFAENPGNNYLLCPSHPGTYKLLVEIIDDVYRAFDRPDKIHLGGDESFGHMKYKKLVKCPICENEDIGKTTVNYLSSLAEYAIGKDMVPQFWADDIMVHSEHLNLFPKETVFIDWLYNRDEHLSDKTGHIWGALDLKGKDPDKLHEMLPSNLKHQLPYMINGGKFNNFYSASYLKDKGYDVMLASGVRSSGDSYYLPRTDYSMKNVFATQKAANKIGCGHLITSWAVRLSHPDTTRPALICTKDGNDVDLKTLNKVLGPLYDNAYEDLKTVEKAVFNIDLFTTEEYRFSLPYTDNYLFLLKQAFDKNKDQIIKTMKKRLNAGNRLIRKLSENLNEKDSDIIRQFVIGIKICMLNAKQTIFLSGEEKRQKETLNKLIQEYKDLIDECKKLWSKSVAPYSLEKEMDVKFLRDLRVLESLTDKM